MDMDSGTLLTVLAAIFGTGGLGGAAVYVWKEREAFYRAYISRLEAEIKAGREKIDELQDSLLKQATGFADGYKIQADTYQRLARSFEEQNDTLKQALGVKQ
jgi:hypothetical protein